MITSLSHLCDDKSLLELVSERESGKLNRFYIDLFGWLEQERVNNVISAMRETNDYGETALHILLKNNQCPAENDSKRSSGNEKPLTRARRLTVIADRGQAEKEVKGGGIWSNLVVVVKKFAEIDSNAFKVQDQYGRIPLHNACQDRSCSFAVIQAVIEAYPAGLGVMSNRKNPSPHTPFDWDHAASAGGHFTDFLQYVVKEDVSASRVKKNTMDTRRERKTMLGHCKNWVPLDILKAAMLNERTLESKEMIRWLNEMPCKRPVVCSMVFEFYLHIARIATFICTTEGRPSFQAWGPIALLVFAAIFFILEFIQLYRFARTNAAIAYWLDVWNWIDLAASSFVAASAIKFLQNGIDGNGDLLISTGFFQFAVLISHLKKTIFSFSKFVNGVIKIFWVLVPFWVISVITLFAFSFMYYVRERKGSYPYDPMPHDSPNPYETLLDSFKTVYSPFAGGPLEETETLLDAMFGMAIVIVLLNVVIAIVTDAWEDAADEADKAFWTYRLDLILEKTRGVNEDRIFQKILGKHFSGFDHGLDELYINTETVGTTMEEVRGKLALTHREKGLFFCFLTIAKSLAFVILGFPTFGILWPKFFRQYLFTPPKPKEDEAKMQMNHIASEVNQCKSDIAAYREEVELLSDRIDSQIGLMQRLLSKEHHLD